MRVKPQSKLQEKKYPFSAIFYSVEHTDVFVGKFVPCPSHAASRWLEAIGVFHKEIEFYAKIRPEMERGCETNKTLFPRVYFAGSDDSGVQCLLMEDLKEQVLLSTKQDFETHNFWLSKITFLFTALILICTFWFLCL